MIPIPHKRILFIGYWNANDPLTHATILPHLRILRGMEQVEYLHFTNIQREDLSNGIWEEIMSTGANYTPLYSKNIRPNILNKALDFLIFPAKIRKLCKEHRINYIIARGAPAGALAWKVGKRLRIPYMVESFEPHADYMRYSCTWKPWDPRYIFEKRWEEKVKQTAHRLVTVSHNYKKALEAEGIPGERIGVAPCAVDPDRFFPSEELRQQKRKELGYSKEAVVGIYAGKFGGLYWEEEAFDLFYQCYQRIPGFHLLLLSNHPQAWVQAQCQRVGLPSDRVHQRFVPFAEVNAWLNAADFAFALYKSTPVSPYLSPVKLGEYWAVGLPVALSENTGDEFGFLEIKGLGLLIRNSLKNNANKLIDIKNQMDGVAHFSRDFRSLKFTRDIYFECLK